MVKGESRHLQCLIPCGGESSRMGLNRNKCLIGIGGKPLLAHIVDFWRGYGVKDFIFIIGGNPESIRETISCVSQMNLANSPLYINRGEMANLVSAINLAKGYIQGAFILALGDCLNIGQFPTFNKNRIGLGFGIGVCPASGYELRKNYSVEIHNHKIIRVTEKPQVEVGMGTLFLNERFFSYINKINPLPQATSVDLTRVLQLAIDEGEDVYPVRFEGEYINITYPTDIELAKEFLGSP